MNMTVKARLMAAFGALLAIVLVVSGLAIYSLGRSRHDFASFVNETHARGVQAHDIRGAADRRAIAVRNLVLVTTPADREVETERVLSAHKQVGERVARLKDTIARSLVGDKERELFAEIERIEAKYSPVAQAIVELALAGKRDEAVAKMNTECRPLLAALIKTSIAYSEHIDVLAEHDIKEAEASYGSNRAMLIVACIAAASAAVALALLITRSLTHALGAEPAQLRAAAQRIAGGDLGSVEGAASAGTNSVLASLVAMQGSLATVVGQVRHASDSIATSSEQIAAGNADLSQRTEHQASNLEETAASMEQMNATVRNNADTARQATQLAASASAAAAKGGEVVGEVIVTMEDISASSSKIADIIGVIDGIAFQTNILALNAAVEAARAGAQGRGFAVVAGEVRTLAHRSAEAAREIKTLIGTSVDKVQSGSRLVGDAGRTMDDIVTQVKRVADLIGEISSATAEQTSGIGQVSTAVTQLDQVTQRNAALVQQGATAVDSLRQQTRKLTEAVDTFKLEGLARA